MALDLDKVYGDDVITRYTSGITPACFTHSYDPNARLNAKGDPLPFGQAVALLRNLRTSVEDWYKKETGEEKMDTLKLSGDRLAMVREKFWGDERFSQAYALLELDPTHQRKISLPWWNDVVAGELEHKLLDERVAHSTFAPAHSFETQLLRAGIPAKTKPVSTDGIIVTAPEDHAPKGYVIVGLRGGASFRNTYHLVAAGALDAPDRFKNGLVSVYDMFKEKEITPELGIGAPEITSAIVHARLTEHVISKGGITYLFVVQTNLRKDELVDRWRNNRSPDKAEHLQLVPIHNGELGVQEFVHQHYRGVVENRQARTDDEQFLLHPGALGLAAYTGMKPSELRALYKEYPW